jgi:hypothetical protein
MTTVLAVSRPSDWNLPLFVHVLGAMILVGGLLTCGATLVSARGDVRFLRLGYWSLLAVALPGWILMRIGAQWIYSTEHWDDAPKDPKWLVIGFITAEGGGLLLLAALIAGGIGVRRLRAGRGAGLLKATMILSLVLLGAYVVTVWAMAGKPG